MTTKLTRPPKLGAVEWFDLPGHAGHRVGLRYVGPIEARRWELAEQRIALDDRATAFANPEAALRADAVELVERVDALVAEVLDACVAGLEGVPDLAPDDDKGAVATIRYLNDGTAEKVSRLARSIQTLTTRERFRAAGAGDGSTGPSAVVPDAG